MSQCHFARTTHPCLTLPVLIYDSHSNGYNNVATDEKVLFFPFQKQTTGMFHWVSVKYIKGYPSTNQTIRPRCSSAKYEEYRIKSARKSTFAMMSMFASKWLYVDHCRLGGNRFNVVVGAVVMMLMMMVMARYPCLTYQSTLPSYFQSLLTPWSYSLISFFTQLSLCSYSLISQLHTFTYSYQLHHLLLRCTNLRVSMIPG